ncbi:Macrophage mannose receptor 1 [Aphelenchoides avenae]|nr:Macrophage mannose receptor 1 [Aphelenchus avenae]
MCKVPSTGGGGEQTTTTAPGPVTTTSAPSKGVPSCWSGWQYISMTNMCYYVTSDFTKENWTDASTLCETEYAGHLASIPSAEANERIAKYVLSRVDEFPPFAFFIGLRTDAANPMLGKWYWTDGSPATFVQWGATPTAAYMNYDCAWSDTTGTWWNDLCDSSGYSNGPSFAVCEREPDFK